ncbi:unnamed protein product [Anisakis simplex]|uniref:DNA-directed RNA polymerases I, II, and III subunit RPABC4 n=1 Tax=Anisakis simplex TaxID=6269 RepID=A0A0M3IZY8_ANISI|nr:unnamed protein product [Anisakis simplex]
MILLNGEAFSECHAENEIRPKDPIRCHDCGHRILYKKRCRKLMVYDAR